MSVGAKAAANSTYMGAGQVFIVPFLNGSPSTEIQIGLVQNLNIAPGEQKEFQVMDRSAGRATVFEQVKYITNWNITFSASDLDFNNVLPFVFQGAEGSVISATGDGSSVKDQFGNTMTSGAKTKYQVIEASNRVASKCRFIFKGVNDSPSATYDIQIDVAEGVLSAEAMPLLNNEDGFASVDFTFSTNGNPKIIKNFRSTS